MLTDTALINLKPKSKIYKVLGRDGTSVAVSAAGSITFRYDYRLNGRRETITLGRYELAGMSLETARERLLDAKRSVYLGLSAALKKQWAERRLTAAETFGQMTERWLADARMADSTHSMRKHIIDRDILPVFQNRKLKKVTPDDLRALCNKVKARGAPATAIHVRDIVKQVYAFAILYGERLANPADDVKAASIATFVPKDRALSPAEIRLAFHKLETIASFPTIRLALRLFLLTMVRKSELVEAMFFRSGSQAAPVAQTQVAAASGFAANAAFDLLAAGLASTAAQPAAPTAVQNMQDQKEEFQQAGTTETRNSGNLQMPASPYQVMAGTVVAGALLTGIKSDLPGDVIAAVTEPVYDAATGRFLLIPQGSRILGRYNSQVSYGQSRVQVVWNRVILPDTSSLTLDNLAGTDPAGYAGMEDNVDWYRGRIFAGAALTRLLGVGAELAAPENCQDGDRIIIAGHDSAQDSINQVGQEMTRRNLDIQPTLTERLGLPVRIIVNGDLVLRPYQPLFFIRGGFTMSTTKKLRLGPLPKTESIKLTFACPASLKADLDRYAALHAQAYGEAVDAVTLIPHMLEAFIVGDRGFRRSLGEGRRAPSRTVTK